MVKFHGLLHLASDVKNFGSPMQFHASRPEHNHKHFCKQPGRRVQMTHKDWELKVAERVWESRCLSMFESHFLSKEAEEVLEKQKTFEGVKKRGTKFVMYFDAETNSVDFEWDTKSDHAKFRFPNNLLSYVVKRYDLGNRPEGLSCFTECLVKDENERDVVVRCHPNYQSRGPWNDWGFVNHNVYREDGSVLEERESPAKFWMWVQEDGEEPQAIVQVCSDWVREKQSVITDSYKFPLKNRRYNGRKYYDVPISNYTKECFVVHKNGLDEVIVVRPYEEWYQLF